MAKPTTYRPGSFTIWVGDGEDPEDFTSKTCALTTKNISFTHGTADVSVPDCDDPDGAIWTERSPTASSATVSGAGLLADETFDFWQEWQASRQPKNVRVVIDKAVPGYWEGAFVITEFGASGNTDEGKLQFTVTLANDGEVVWVNGAP